MAWIVQLLIAVAMNVIAYLIQPKPKQAKPEAAKQSETPTADAGIPVPVPFGTITAKGLNVMWYGDQNMSTYQVKA